jgi:hypothetical protein
LDILLKKAYLIEQTFFWGNENNAHEMEAINNHKLFFQNPLGPHPWAVTSMFK